MSTLPTLDKNGLRDFGLITGAIMGGLFGLLLPWLRDRPFPVWPWVVAAILWLWALVAPGSLKLVYRYWMKVGLILGWINTRIILGLAFWLIILPLGLVLRLLNEKTVRKITAGFDGNLRTYWVPSRSTTREKMEKPF